MQLPTTWIKSWSSSDVMSNKWTCISPLACLLTACLTAVGLWIPGTLMALLPFLCGFFMATVLIIMCLVSQSTPCEELPAAHLTSALLVLLNCFSGSPRV